MWGSEIFILVWERGNYICWGGGGGGGFGGLVVAAIMINIAEIIS